MQTLIMASQLIIAGVLLNVWIFRYEQMRGEFQLYRLPDWLRVFTCFSKVTIAILLMIGLWYQDLTLVATQLLMVFMACAILAHMRVRNPVAKAVPAISVFLLCIMITLGMK